MTKLLTHFTAKGLKPLLRTHRHLTDLAQIYLKYDYLNYNWTESLNSNY